MLGLANTVSSSSTPESKYSLTFDGSDDFINLGPSNNFISTSQAEVSLSVWIKSSTDEDSKYVFANQRGTGNSNFSLRFFTDGNRIRLFTWNGSSLDATTAPSDSDITDGNWHHVVATGKTSEQKIYIDGSLETTATNAFSMEPSADTCSIGNFNNTANFQGQINDLALWNVVLDADAVTAIYNGGKPTNLTFDSGNYDNSSALVAYYKMGNGFFDDKANGVIHDQHAPGFGSEMWDGVQGDDANWQVFSGNAKAEDSGAVKITFGESGSSSGGYIYLRDAKDLNDDLVVGTTYKLTFSTKINTGSVLWEITNNTVGSTYSDNSAITNTSFEDHSIYFVAQETQGDFLYSGNMGAGEEVWIKDISLKKLNGLPGLTSSMDVGDFTSDTP